MMDKKGYRIIETEDGAPSLFSEEYDQAMHTLSGAYEESLLKHVFPCKIMERGNKELHVLDIGFGIAYNVLAQIIQFLKKERDQHLTIVSLEKDTSYFPLFNSISFEDERDHIYSLIKEALKKGGIETDKFSLEIILGDARTTIRTIDGIQFDAVFHDPYSPSKNPELWSVEFFKEIFKKMDPNGILSTYSSSYQARAALLEAGFYVSKGPSVGKKKEGTLASKIEGITGLPAVDISAMKDDPKFAAYRDISLCDSREEILKRRKKEIQHRKAKLDPQVHQE